MVKGWNTISKGFTINIACLPSWDLMFSHLVKDLLQSPTTFVVRIRGSLSNIYLALGWYPHWSLKNPFILNILWSFSGSINIISDQIRYNSHRFCDVGEYEGLLVILVSQASSNVICVRFTPPKKMSVLNCPGSKVLYIGCLLFYFKEHTDSKGHF